MSNKLELSEHLSENLGFNRLFVEPSHSAGFETDFDFRGDVSAYYRYLGSWNSSFLAHFVQSLDNLQAVQLRHVEVKKHKSEVEAFVVNLSLEFVYSFSAVFGDDKTVRFNSHLFEAVLVSQATHVEVLCNE